MDEFSEEERRLLEPFVTNMDKSVFVLTNLPEVVKGALFSRYSRSANSLRKVLLKEFMQSEELGIEGFQSLGRDSLVKTKKAEEFYDRILVGYGDDSVAELAGAHIALEEISIIATKIVEDARIGLSPLEKSTRYVYFDKKREDGSWPYLKEKTIMKSEFADMYIKTCDLCFQTYSDLVPKVSEYIMEKEPKDEETSDRAYRSTVRAKTCDILRGLLPASTLTNMGFFGDGRAYEYLITKMYGDDLSEIRDLAGLMQGELAKVIPSFVKRANNKYGIAMQDYLKKVRSDMGEIADRYPGSGGEEGVKLIEYDKDAERKIIIAALYPYLEQSMEEISRIVDQMSDEEKQTVISKYINERGNRRQKPGRGFEHAYYTFDVVANYGAYRDIHRHRILTQERQLLGPHLGYKLPTELVDSGYQNEFTNVMEEAKNTYEQISKKFKKEAQYVIPLAYNIRWYMTYNIREAYHLLELRSAMQGHIDYRRIAQNMFREIKKVHPNLAAGMKYMDMQEYGLERLEAEKKLDKKMEELNKKYGK
ncbi:FAD-dependent thymidylate synthase [Candidatus Micrarchaeota archaeon]|nr:FAD-dependent thymidylate synthase [Candidatus Micrarchaeota archaeon]MBU1682105.1 FAD-dependent thymidylate synthase [Candidatus Micrarchaeota archaeon]